MTHPHTRVFAHQKENMTLEKLTKEYKEARDQWYETVRLRAYRKSNDPVFKEVVANYYEKRNALYRYLRINGRKFS